MAERKSATVLDGFNDRDLMFRLQASQLINFLEARYMLGDESNPGMIQKRAEQLFTVLEDVGTDSNLLETLGMLAEQEHVTPESVTPELVDAIAEGLSLHLPEPIQS